MTTLRDRISRVRTRIESAACAADRSPESVRLIAISKTFGPDLVLEAAESGQRAFGENRVQEALEKISKTRRPGAPHLEWHLVGSLQRNKAARAIELFDVIHSVDRPELARALARAAERRERRPRVLIQVNVDEEPQKSGVAPRELAALAETVAALPSLKLAGLMALPRATSDPQAQRPAFARLRSLLEELKLVHPGLCELSMGMSADFEVAIAEGATWVRVGTAIFGERGRT